MGKYMIFSIFVILLIFILTNISSCDLSLSKSNGEVTKLRTIESYQGNYYYVTITYETSEEGKYRTKELETTKQIYDSLSIGDEVYAYYNSIKLKSFIKKDLIK